MTGVQTCALPILALAKGLVLGGVARRVLLITAETITRTIHPQDKSTRTLFGDAAAATLVEASAERGIGEFVLGTDGSGAERLIIPAGAWASPSSPETRVETTNKWGQRPHPGESLYGRAGDPQVLDGGRPALHERGTDEIGRAHF